MKQNKNSPMFVLIAFFLLISILMDDLSTGIIYYLGLGSLESNPVARAAGYGGMMLVNLGIYLLILFLIKWLTRTYRDVYKNKKLAYKMYDSFIFFACLIVMFLVITKIELGYTNYSHIYHYSVNEDFREEIIENAELAKDLIKNNPEKYDEIMDSAYSGLLSKLNFIQFLFIAMCAYILTRVDHRVTPWGYD